MNVISVFTSIVLPLLLLLFALVLLKGKKDLFDEFLIGAREGIQTAANLIPTLVLIMVGVNMLFASGAVDVLVLLIGPIASRLGVPSELLPNIILRPFSGSATTAVADKLFYENGADSDVGKIASVLMGSTDTIVYTLAVYFSAVNIKKTRHAITSSFIVFVFSIFVSIIFAKLFVL